MIPAIVNDTSKIRIREKDVESIVDWFEQHQRVFYILGLTYFKNQQQVEELFFQSILKVHKELPRYKSNTSFETWVTSIYIHNCRELYNVNSLKASEEKEPPHTLFNALDQLKGYEKEAMALTYVKGFSHEETAQILQVSVVKIKEFLFSGIQSLRKEMGYGPTFNGCKKYHKDYIDYLERTLERSKKIDLEDHVYHCQDCQEDLGTFQDVMLTMLNLTERIDELIVPPRFMKNVKDRVEETEKHRLKKNKKRKRIGLIIAGVFALLIGIGYFTGAFTNLYYTWTEEDQELRTFLQQDLGERLYLEAESNGVKIRIKSAIADDVQTLVFYEIEDTKEDNQYMMNFHDGVFVVNENEIMNLELYPRYYYPDLQSDVNSQEKNVYHGKISLQPLKTDNGTIQLQIRKLQQLIRNNSDGNDMGAYENVGYKTGKWDFEIPITKQPSVEYVLDEKTEVEGIPIRFDKLTIAPTATILQFGIHNKQEAKRIEVLNFEYLEMNKEKMKDDMYGNSFLNLQQSENWTDFQAYFGPYFGEKPKEVSAQFESVHLRFEDQIRVELDASQKYPHIFEYAGSTISIDKVEIDQLTSVHISTPDTENRTYQSLNFDIVGENENISNSMEIQSEGVLVDKYGEEYDINGETPVVYEEIEEPLYYQTVYRVRLHSDNTGEKVIPRSLVIYGYNSMKYLDDVVKFSLD